MSKLDDIYTSTAYANPPKGMAYGINLANDAVYQALKEQIKDLMLSLVRTNGSKVKLIKSIEEL